MGTKGLICLEPILKNIPPSLLIRPSSCPPVQASPIQGEIDGWVGGFVHQATDWRSLGAMVAGGVAGRGGPCGAGGNNGIACRGVWPYAPTDRVGWPRS